MLLSTTVNISDLPPHNFSIKVGAVIMLILKPFQLVATLQVGTAWLLSRDKEMVEKLSEWKKATCRDWRKLLGPDTST